MGAVRAMVQRLPEIFHICCYLQPHRHHTGLLLLDLWTQIRIVSTRINVELCYALLIHVVCRRQMVLSRFWFGWYGVKLSKLVRPID